MGSFDSEAIELQQANGTLGTTIGSGVFRWLSKDPIGIARGLNQYVFCANNPVNRVDPFGLADFDAETEIGVLTSSYSRWNLIGNHVQMFRNHSGLGGYTEHDHKAMGDRFIFDDGTIKLDNEMGNFEAGLSAGYAGFPFVTPALVHGGGSLHGIAAALIDPSERHLSQLFFLGDDWGSVNQIVRGYWYGSWIKLREGWDMATGLFTRGSSDKECK